MTKTNLHISAHAIVNWFYCEIMQTNTNSWHKSSIINVMQFSSHIANKIATIPFFKTIASAPMMNNRQKNYLNRTHFLIHGFRDWPPFYHLAKHTQQHFLMRSVPFSLSISFSFFVSFCGAALSCFIFRYFLPFVSFSQHLCFSSRNCENHKKLPTNTCRSVRKKTKDSTDFKLQTN